MFDGKLGCLVLGVAKWGLKEQTEMKYLKQTD
jgi:hypothetical protein